MKTRHNPRGPFTEQPYFTNTDIDSLCIEELGKVGLYPDKPQPIRIDRFIEKRFDKPHSYEDLQDGILGLTRFGSRGVEEIVISRSLEDDMSKPAERRLRSTLAHEAGHALLHAHLFVLSAQKPLLGDWSEANRPKVLCRDTTHAGYKGDWWEYQANMVMGAILLPKPLVHAAIDPFLKRQGMLQMPVLPSVDRETAVRALAEQFDVNPVVVRIRLDKLFPPERTGQMAL
jgi:hypothetical protein